MTESKWCPTQAGSTRAFAAEYFDVLSGKWFNIPDARVTGQTPINVGYPMLCGGIFKQIGLLGESQAEAIAAVYKADNEARCEFVSVRVVGYKVEYDIKAMRDKTEEIEEK